MILIEVYLRGLCFCLGIIESMNFIPMLGLVVIPFKHDKKWGRLLRRGIVAFRARARHFVALPVFLLMFHCTIVLEATCSTLLVRILSTNGT
jgi:hypothetical protein